MNLHFLSGLPRTGSTLLANLLMQSPDIYASNTSGLPEVLRGIRDGWENVEAFKANPCPEAKRGLLRGAIEGYYGAITDKPVVFDKSRAWPEYIEMVEHIFDRPAKIVATVRNPQDILASFEKLHRRTVAQKASPIKTQEGGPILLPRRLEIIASAGGPLGSAYNALKDAFDRGLRDRFLLVEFDDLTTNPEREITRVCDFIGLERFVINPRCVKQVLQEDDEVYGYVGLHAIREQVSPVPSDWQTVLGESGKKYAGLEFWR